MFSVEVFVFLHRLGLLSISSDIFVVDLQKAEFSVWSFVFCFFVRDPGVLEGRPIWINV